MNYIKEEEYLITIKQEPDLEIIEESVTILTDKKCEIKSETLTNEEGNQAVYCHVCHKKFINLDEIKIHYDKNHMNHKCNLCNIFLSNQKNFKIHNKKFHSVNKYYKYPSSTFKLSTDLKVHTTTNNDSVKSESISASSAENVKTEINCEHLCCFCSKVFQNVIELRDHIKFHMKDPHQHTRKVILNKCGNCGITFSHLKDLEFHKELHYSFDVSKRHRCISCAETFSNPLDIYNHNVNLYIFVTRKDFF